MEIAKRFDRIADIERDMHLLQVYVLEGLLPTIIDPRNVIRVLDVPCRLGYWAEALAYAYPHIHVTALDDNPDHIAAIQQRTDHPDNAYFEASNLELFPQKREYKFDLVHIDAPFIFRPAQGWDYFLAQCKHRLKRGGFINLVSIVPGMGSSDAYQRIVYLARQWEAPESPATFCHLLKQVGFTHIRYTLHPIDLSGQVYQRFLDSTILEHKQPLYDAQIVDKEDLDSLLVQKQRQTKDVHFCAMGMIISLLAQKQ